MERGEVRGERAKLIVSSGENIFFFKQKTAYENLRSLVGSEMCIIDRDTVFTPLDGFPYAWLVNVAGLKSTPL